MARILVACEYSGRVREAFRRRGHEAWSCDFLEAEDGSPWHFQGDVREMLERGGWAIIRSHPPCTYLAVSGIHWNKRVPGRAELTEEALGFVRLLMGQEEGVVKRWAVENPVSIISSRIRKPDQIIQPWMFGEDASKATCLWLQGLPLLRWSEENRVEGRLTKEGKRRWSNQTDSGQNRLAPSEDRWKERSRTFLGIAEAMAEQWSRVL